MSLISVLGGANIGVGVCSILLYMIIVGIKVPLYNTGCGLWAGALLVLAGSMGIFAGKAQHRMAFSFALLFGVVSLLADMAALAISIYVFYYLTQVSTDSRHVMPIFQVYLGFNSLWFLVVLAAFFTALLQVRTAWSEMPERGQKHDAFVRAEAPPQSQPASLGGYPQAQGGFPRAQGAYQPAPRPYYY